MNDSTQHLREVLRRSEQELDAATIQQLNSARTRALNAEKPRIPRFFVPVTGMAVATAFALILVLSPATQDPSLNQDDMLISEGLDLYEDMDFYYWLANEENNLQG